MKEPLRDLARGIANFVAFTTRCREIALTPLTTARLCAPSVVFGRVGGQTQAKRPTDRAIFAELTRALETQPPLRLAFARGIKLTTDAVWDLEIGGRSLLSFLASLAPWRFILSNQG